MNNTLIVSYGKELGLCFLLAGLIAFISISSKKENLIMLIISLEIILLAIGILFVHVSFLFDDLIGATLTLYLLPLAGAESAIALAIYIAYYPTRGTKIIS
jgi:NADH:ubiquinone oxidoreductase subunit K